MIYKYALSMIHRYSNRTHRCCPKFTIIPRILQKSYNIVSKFATISRIFGKKICVPYCIIMAILHQNEQIPMDSKNVTVSHWLASVKTWLSGLECQKSHRKVWTPELDIEVVFAAMAKAPFEPIDKISLKYLTLKTIFQ